MPVCQSCHHKWSWKQTFVKSFSFIGGMRCTHCGEKQYVTARVKKRGTVIPLCIVLLTAIGNYFFTPTYVFLYSLAILLPLVLVINPFFVELSSEEEPLF